MYNTDAPLFPEHVDNEHFHISTIVLPAFAGSQFREGPYGALSAPGKSDGKTHAVSSKVLPVKEFIQAIEWVIKHDAQIRDALFESLVEHYEEFREYEEDKALVPDIQSSNELLSLSGLVALHINSISDNGDPIFGIELGCNWDSDQGAGASFRGLNVESAGDANHSLVSC